MTGERAGQAEKTVNIILFSIVLRGDTPLVNYFYNESHCQAILKNPESLKGALISGAELKAELYPASGKGRAPGEVFLVLEDSDFLPDTFCAMLNSHPPELTTFFGIISRPDDSASGRYYMLRDCNRDGLILCTGNYSIRSGKGYCDDFDGQWFFRYDIIENFFYGCNRPESEIVKWRHPGLRLKRIDDNLVYKDLSKRFRDYAAGWHRYNFFSTDDWTLRFYHKQARLGFIAITHTIDGELKLTPQLQREYAVLDWPKLVIDKKVRKIIKSGRIESENIRLNISADPSEVLQHLRKHWIQTWITDEYEELIKSLAGTKRRGRLRGIRILGVTLTAGAGNVIAGELGYSIGKTYTSLSGFFHRENRNYNNFGKLQMILLAKRLEQAGFAFWNLGQPYMEYKLKLGADVFPRGLFFKRWDRAVRGRSPKLL